MLIKGVNDMNKHVNKRVQSVIPRSVFRVPGGTIHTSQSVGILGVMDMCPKGPKRGYFKALNTCIERGANRHLMCI